MSKFTVYLPSFTELTRDQQRAVDKNSCVNMIGPAGAGKSVVNLFRHIRNINKGKNSAIICFNNTLQKYLLSATKEVNTDAAMRIHTLWGFARDGFIGQNGTWLYKNSWGGDCRGRQKYCKNGQKLDEIIVDEAQDVENEAFEVLRSSCFDLSCGSDFNQQIYNSGISQEKLEYFLNQNKNGYENIFLRRNFRNTIQIANFIASFLPNFDETGHADKSGPKPRVYSNEQKGDKSDTDIIKELLPVLSGSTAILLPYSNKDSDRSANEKSNVDYYYGSLKDFTPSKYHSNMSRTEKDAFRKNDLSSVFVTTFKSAKGLEFDNVIIPKINQMDEIISQNVFSEKDYYVAFSRARTNLFLISDEPISNLARFDSDFVSTELYDVDYFNSGYNINEDEIPW